MSEQTTTVPPTCQIKSEVQNNPEEEREDEENTTKQEGLDGYLQYQKEEGCVAFQLVKVFINFYGKLIEDVLDSKILEDGRKIVTNGNGYIKAGFEIN
jgi:hypothetical protein